MSLTDQDLQNIREVIREEITAVENDVKEIYGMIGRMQKQLDTVVANVKFIAGDLRIKLPSPSK